MQTPRGPGATSPGPALSSPRAVVLHVGMGKTGTSSIQYFLRDNRERLGELDVLYPRSLGRGRHHRLGLLVKSDEDLLRSPEWPREKQTEPGRFRRSVRRRLISEIEGSDAARVLLSDEILFGRSPAELRRLRRLLDRLAQSLRVVAYLRRQDDHLVSRYQQGVKIGWVCRLTDWVHEDMSDLYDYHRRLRILQRILRPDELVVRSFEPEAFPGGSLLQDFLDAAGIDARADDLAQVERRNESLDAESVEFLRLLNLYRVESQAATPGLIDNRTLAERLSHDSTGPVLTLPDPVLEAFMDQWAEPNRRVALDHLGDPEGRLFRRQRRSDHVTTRQHLDPARLDHFLALAELPAPVHAPLRAIAEREVSGRA